MVNIADIRSHLEAVETAERNLALIKAFAANGGAYKLGVTVDTKEAWDGAQIAGIVSQYLVKLPILGSVEKHLKEEIEAAKSALVGHVVGEHEKYLQQSMIDAMETEVPQFLRRAK